MPSFNHIVIGAGPNGLACATKLAQSGARVALLEAGAGVGGGAAGYEFAPGYPTSLAHVLHALDSRVLHGMALEDHGLSYASRDLDTVALAENGAHLTINGASLSGDGAGLDREAYAVLHAKLVDFARVLAPFKALSPPRIARGAGNPMLKLGQLGWGVRRLGCKNFREFLRMILINIADVLEDDLSDERLRGALAFDATLGAWLGPRSPNSLILLLNRLASSGAGKPAALTLPAGGMGAVAAAMQKAAEAAGVSLHCNAKVTKISVRDDRATGVVLENGDEYFAQNVISAINPKTTLLGLVGPAHLDTEFLRRIRSAKSRGAAARLHLGLKSAPDFRGADLKSRLLIAPGVNAVENAFNAVKYGEVPKAPVMEIIMPSAHEGGHAPDGKHQLSAIVQFAPHDPKGGLEAARKLMLTNALAVLERFAPGIGKLVEHSEMLMPQDIEARFGMVGGNWHHGELAVENMLFLRPTYGAAQYATPLPGLWLAGAGSHPGGGISGAAGWNAALRILSGKGAV
ncbi:MAG: NAD(P)/FAD-dependent oxidoreductase [Paracoccaceae bacterium]